MTEPTRGLLDRSVVVDHDVIDPDLLPDQSAIAAIALAELATGPHATEEDACIAAHPLVDGTYIQRPQDPVEARLLAPRCAYLAPSR